MTVQINLVGNWNKSAPMYGFNRIDQGILTSEKGRAKIARSFKVEDINLIFVRDKSLKWHWQNNVVRDSDNIKPLINEEMINFVFTQNEGTGRLPTNAWIIAHRMGHALMAHEFRHEYSHTFMAVKNVLSDFLQSIYGHTINKRSPIIDFGDRKATRAFMQLGTMRSCREKTLLTGTEFMHELFAQYVITGRITFNRTFSSFRCGKYGADRMYARRKFDDALIGDMENNIENIFAGFFMYNVGETYSF